MKVYNESLIAWTPPSNECKLNTNWSMFQHSGSTACGGILCDSSGNLVVAYSANLSNCSITMAKLWPIYFGLQISYRLGLRRILVASDLLCAIQLLHQREVAYHSSLSMIQVIEELMSRDWIVEVKHIFKEANQCIDVLARRGHDNHLGAKFYDSVPDFFFFWLIWLACPTFD